MAIINRIINKIIELFQAFIKSTGIWEAISDLVYKIFG